MIFKTHRYCDLGLALEHATKAKCLRLDRPSVADIETAAQALTNLEELSINWLVASQVPDCFGNLLKLRRFYCLNTPITDIPPSIFALKGLRSVVVRQGNLTAISSGILDLPKLEKLDLWQNELAELPAWIGELKHLRFLRLGFNRICRLPTEVENLEKLELLDLRSNRLARWTVPHSAFPRLRFLSVDGNPLDSVSREHAHEIAEIAAKRGPVRDNN